MTLTHSSGDWRPAPGIEVPQRSGWTLEQKLGDGSVGEAWLARHYVSGKRRVFQFCFDLEQIPTLRAEESRLRLLKEVLGDRADITRICAWDLDEAPFFIESEFTPSTTLDRWLLELGGVAEVPLALRLEILARVADALAAAHSVGVPHRDLRPCNILVETDARADTVARDGVRIRLSNFGFSPSSLPNSARHLVPSLYQAPEACDGTMPSGKADIYALGVLLLQLVTADLEHPLAPDWEQLVEDPVLRRDIAAATDRLADQRPGARRLAFRLRSLEDRRRELAAEQRARRRHERRRWFASALASVL